MDDHVLLHQNRQLGLLNIAAVRLTQGSEGSPVMESKSSQNSRAFSIIDPSPGQMEGKQREHTDTRQTVICTRAVYTSSASTL